jgi:predicted dehydrogenase
MALDLTTEQRKLGQANFKAATSDLSRRGFMKTVAAGAGVVPVAAAVYFGYESIWGHPVKAALIGCGDEGGVLLGEHNPDYIQFVAACDIRPSNRKRIIEGDPKVPLRKGFKKIYGKDYADDIDKNHFYADFRTMLDKEKDIEAVVIALPLHLHCDVSVECMQRGKHVLCEKLMARNVAECRKMIKTAEQTNRILSIGHQRHYSVLYAEANELLKSNVIGDVKHIRALWHRNFSWEWKPDAEQVLAGNGVLQPHFRDGWTPPILADDYQELKDKLHKQDKPLDPFDYKDIYELIRWRLYERTGGGLMAELGSHQLDASSIFLGKVHPLSVQGVGTKSFFGPNRNDREIDDHVFVTFEFPGKNHPHGPNKGSDKHDIVVLTYSSISTNGFENYGECVMGDRGTLIVEKEESAMLYKENEPGKKDAPRSTDISVKTSSAGAPALASGSTWGGPTAGAVPAATAGGPAGPPPSRGYREEMEDFAYCIRRWDPSVGYASDMKDGKKVYKNRLPKCHGEVAMADAILALTSNLAMAQRERIEFTDAHFDPNSTEVPTPKKA